MEGKNNSQEKLEKILRELGLRKEIKTSEKLFVIDNGEGRMGNIDSCNDFPPGGAGNVSACDDDVCSDGNDDVAGNYNACTDDVCG